MAIKDNQLCIESTEWMWITYHNIGGLPPMDTSHLKYTEAYIQEVGLKVRAKWEFKLIPKWTAEKEQTIQAENNIVQAAIDGLLKKHEIDHLKRSYRWHEELILGETEGEEKRIAAYKAEKEILEKQIVQRPLYESEEYALISLGYNWTMGMNASHMVAKVSPVSEEKKGLSLIRLIEAELRVK